MEVPVHEAPGALVRVVAAVTAVVMPGGDDDHPGVGVMWRVVSFYPRHDGA